MKYEALNEGMVCRKRWMWELNGEQPSDCLEHGSSKGGVVRMGRRKGDYHTSYFRVIRNQVNDKPDGTAVKRTRQVIPRP